MQIQVIDYLNKDAPAQFAAALKEIGFAVLSNHSIDQHLIEQVYQEWFHFFKSSPNEQAPFLFDTKTHDGFINFALSETAKGYSKKDLKEFYHYYPWGRCPDALRPNTQLLMDGLSEMAAKLLGWLETHMPAIAREKLSQPLSKMIENCPRTLFRILHYPPLTGQETPDALRAAPHADINLLTLLPAATAKGLEVKDANGNWLPVPCRKDWIIVNVGDTLQECTNFYYPSTAHRVTNPTGEEASQPRLSMPLFLHARDDVILSQRYTAASYRAERFKELGLK